MKLFNCMVTSLLISVLSASTYAGNPVYTGENGDVAVEGHDVVAYFTDGEPIEGSTEYSMQWRGAEWRFANEAHLSRFREDPEKYAPAYGGYCAYGVAKGKALASSPEYWAIHDGRLYLNLNADIHGNWNEDREGHVAAANKQWPKVAR